MSWVIAQVVVLAFVLWLPNLVTVDLPAWAPRATVILTWAGFLVLGRAVYDLRRSLSVAPKPVDHGTLQTSGIYGFVRHPMYLGVWLVMGGGLIRSGSLLKMASLLLVIVFFVIKMRHEEKMLAAKYSAYSDYKKRVGAFFPRFPK